MSDDTPPDDRSDGGFSLPMPPDYDDEQRAAFTAGFRACSELFASAAMSYVNALDDGDDPDDGDPDECPDCGGDLFASMGAAETATPAGKVCPDCEL